MTRKIQSIKTMSNKYEYTVYVNFDNGTYGTHTKNKETGKWFDGGLKADELAKAKSLALVDGKWTNWTANKNQRAEFASQPETFENMPGITNEENELLRRNSIARGEPEFFG